MGKNNGTKSWADKQVFTTGEAADGFSLFGHERLVLKAAD